jgi:hypothetical protein
MRPGSLLTKVEPSNWRHCLSSQRPLPTAIRALLSEPNWAATGPLFRRTTKCGLPWMTSDGKYLRFSPHIEQTTWIELAGKPSVPLNTSWPHFLQQTTQHLGKGRVRMATNIGE